MRKSFLHRALHFEQLEPRLPLDGALAASDLRGFAIDEYHGRETQAGGVRVGCVATN